MLTVKIEEQIRERQPIEYHYLSLARKGLLQLAKKIARIRMAG